MSKVVAIVSGGLDSTVLLYRLLDQGHDVHALSFDYGQRHVRELMFAQETCRSLINVVHDEIDLSGLTHLISNSALTSHADARNPLVLKINRLPQIEVPDGHYAEDNMKQTVVPNRNMIMLSIAGGVAVNDGAEFVATGVHAGDHFVYPDCREQFINAASLALTLGNDGFSRFGNAAINAPFLSWTKADIAYEGIKLGVDFSKTWSCYKGSGIHCGRCGTCVERLEAIDEAITRWDNQAGVTTYTDSKTHRAIRTDTGRIIDMTEYADTEFWKQAVAAAKA